MILTRGDGRQEIDLLPPQSPAEVVSAVLPSPVCPQAVIATSGDGFEEPVGPGESHLDDELPRPGEASSEEGGGS